MTEIPRTVPMGATVMDRLFNDYEEYYRLPTEQKEPEPEPAPEQAPRCEGAVETYNRVCGFFRPVQHWNKGKKEEFKDRKEYIIE